jgi:transcriptional regulator with XRE-family HTH domain
LPRQIVQMDELGKRLRARAKDLGLSDSEVARRAGLEATRYGHYVGGRRKPDYVTLGRICEVLGVTPNDILGTTEGQPEKSNRSRLTERLTAVAAALSDRDLRIAVALAETLLEQERSEVAAKPNRKARLRSKR